MDKKDSTPAKVVPTCIYLVNQDTFFPSIDKCKTDRCNSGGSRTICILRQKVALITIQSLDKFITDIVKTSGGCAYTKSRSDVIDTYIRPCIPQLLDGFILTDHVALLISLFTDATILVPPLNRY